MAPSSKLKTNAPAYNPPVTQNDINPICPNCGYNLDGLAVPNTSSRTCPECGMSGVPASSNNIFTAMHMHKYFATRLLLPTTLPILTMIMATAAWPSAAAFSCVLTILLPFALILILIATQKSMIEAGERPPHRFNQSTIPLWAWLYASPGIVCYLAYLRSAF